MTVPAFLQGPGVIKAVFGSLRGYAGNISAAGALDAVSNDGNTLIIDIRQAPSLPVLCLRSQASMWGKTQDLAAILSLAAC